MSAPPLVDSAYTAFLLPSPAPRKNRRKRPALVSARRRVFMRVVEPKAPTIFACSRSITRSVASSLRRCRSRSWMTIPFLAPSMKNVVGLAMRQFMAFRNIPFYMGTHATAHVPRPIEEIGVIRVHNLHRWNQDFHPPFRAAFHDAMTLRQIFQAICERSTAIKSLCDQAGIRTRQLEENVGMDREDSGAHLRRVLVQELVGRNDADAELAGFR